MKTVDRNEVKSIIDSPDNEILVEVLAQSEFEKAHLPDAISVPLGEDFEARIQEAVPNKDRTVIVYCQNEECPASPEAGKRMEKIGYENVLDYAAGKDDWREAGLPMIERPSQP